MTCFRKGFFAKIIPIWTLKYDDEIQDSSTTGVTCISRGNLTTLMPDLYQMGQPIKVAIKQKPLENEIRSKWGTSNVKLQIYILIK